MSGVRKFAFGAVFVLGAAAVTLAASRAEAKSHFSLGIDFGGPVYAQPYYDYPAPAYYAPAPVYVAPRPAYYYPPPPPVYYAPAPAYYAPHPIYERRWHHEDDED
jgi:hypothetical protein